MKCQTPGCEREATEGTPEPAWCPQCYAARCVGFKERDEAYQRADAPSVVKPALPPAVWAVYEAAKAWKGDLAREETDDNCARILWDAVDAALKAEAPKSEKGEPGTVGRAAAEAVLADAEKEQAGKPEAPMCADCGKLAPEDCSCTIWFCRECLEKRARIAKLKGAVKVGDVVAVDDGRLFWVGRTYPDGVSCDGKSIAPSLPWRRITAVYKKEP